MYFLKAHSEAYQPTEEEKKAHARRLLEWEHLQAFNSAVSESEEAFKLKDYARVVQLLSPFEDELLKISATKLKLARKKQ